ncbi:30S ribosomal protein S3 [Candidatus Carsonella ruddii]|uniref:Small ribosomal subunit protein uS3 n=1 Tax=Candidatus Carsonella ruddii HC isolate Thao2000 TaxID=1202538 RepID=J3TEC1_CARRU|nr:30S ribosomal protein S3 [Candidatus Carsonella ruddii]AFP84017.1 ribosomal protein S3 [Candidatus Carsonella ruddii HC isolate Thao2000]
MGKKIHPIFFRLGKSSYYHSFWFINKKKYFFFLKIDILIREIIKKNFFFINIIDIDIIISNFLKLNIYFNDLLKIENFVFFMDPIILEISKILKKNIIINFILEENVNSKSLSYLIINQINNKSSLKRIIKKEILKLLNKFNGCKIQISGRLEGVDIARKEWYLFGSIPLHTIRNNIDYYFNETITQYGILGIKIWIFKKKYETKT